MTNSEKVAVTDKQFVEPTLQQIEKRDYLNKTVPSKKTVSEIVGEIKNGTWSSILEINVEDFVESPQPNEYVPKGESIIQVRPVLINHDFITEQVTKVKNTKDYSGLEKAILVYFPEELIINGEVIAEANSYKLLGGSHGIVISSYLDIWKKDAYIVNFELDLGSNYLKLYRLGNLLNNEYKVRNGLEKDAIKLEVWRQIDDNINTGLQTEKESSLTREQQDSFLEDYQQINQGHLTNWMSTHEFGGRNTPSYSWSIPERQAFADDLRKQKCYSDYVIIEPTTLHGWKNEALGRLIQAGVDYTRKNDKESRKFLMPLWASTQSQVDELKQEGEIKQNQIKNRLDEIRIYLRFDVIQPIFMQYE
jgi:hypothetical protein